MAFCCIAQEDEAHPGTTEVHSCRCSFYEIYNEQIFDLAARDAYGGSRDGVPLSIREATDKGIFLEGLIEEKVVVLCACP